jgi:photosystem II stability/assembly factor-like uncharacterized protein
LVEGVTEHGLPVLVATFNAGASWTTVYQGDEGGTWSDLHLLSPRVGLATLAFADPRSGRLTGTLLATSDGGRTWTTVSKGAAGELTDLKFLSPQVGFAILASVTSGPGDFVTGTFQATANGGRTWRPVELKRLGQA